MRGQYFLITVAMIFLLERLLPLFVGRPVSIFSLFAIGFLIQSRDLAHDFVGLTGASLFFDFFSGLEFGVLTLIILALALAAHLLRKVVSIESASLVSWIRSSFILFLVYLVLSSTALPLAFLLRHLPLLFFQALIGLVILFLLFRVITKNRYDTEQIQNQKA